MAKLYSLAAVQKVIDAYSNAGGDIVTINEGCLGYGTMLLCGVTLKTTIVQEIYLNEWSSAHTIRSYNKCPKKYEKYLTY